MKKLFKIIIPTVLLILGILLSGILAIFTTYDIQKLPLIHCVIIFFVLGYFSSHLNKKLEAVDNKDVEPKKNEHEGIK